MSWIQTFTGQKLYFLNPTPDTINIRDIAHALSQICRYSGQCTQFYSVAQHCFLMSVLIEEEHALQALLHDATEAYMSDIPSPLKRLLPRYQSIEDNLLSVVFEKFGLPQQIHPRVDEFDHSLCLAERKALFQDWIPWGWEHNYDVPEVKIVSLKPDLAEAVYLARFRELTDISLRKDKTNGER